MSEWVKYVRKFSYKYMVIDDLMVACECMYAYLDKCNVCSCRGCQDLVEWANYV